MRLIQGLELKKNQFDEFLKEKKILVYSVLTFCLCFTYLESYKCFCFWLTVPRISFDIKKLFSLFRTFWKIYSVLMWCLIKGTVNVISSDSPWKDDNVRFIMIPLGFKVFNFDNSIMLCCSRNAQVTFVDKKTEHKLAF